MFCYLGHFTPFCDDDDDDDDEDDDDDDDDDDVMFQFLCQTQLISSVIPYPCPSRLCRWTVGVKRQQYKNLPTITSVTLVSSHLFVSL